MHYLNELDTIECIESILSHISYEKYQIIVVDNGSSNKSGERLLERYLKNAKVTVLVNQQNLGFAKGNNVGFKYAKHEQQTHFIAMINNDTFIDQHDFVDKILEKYKNTTFHILGPDIISPVNGRHQNPCISSYQKIEVLKKFIINNKISLILNYFLLDKVLEKIKKKIIKRPLIVPQKKSFDKFKNKEMHNVMLHASCLIFSPLYIEEYEGLYAKTFMYLEEDILYYIAKRDRLKTLYYPDVKIYHKEDASTNYLLNKDYLTRRFYLKNFLRSGKAFLELMNPKIESD